MQMAKNRTINTQLFELEGWDEATLPHLGITGGEATFFGRLN
jgi:hypothetical protein